MDQPEPLCSHLAVLGSPSNPDVAWLLSTASPPPYPEATFWPSSYVAINIHQLSLGSSRLLEAHFPGEATGGGREGFWRLFWTRQLLLGADLGAAGLVAPSLQHRWPLLMVLVRFSLQLAGIGCSLLGQEGLHIGDVGDVCVRAARGMSSAC